MAGGIATFKGIYSVTLLILSVVLIQGLIYLKQTKLSSGIHPVLVSVALWCAVGWLSTIEGFQCSLVGLAPINRELYKDSHKIAYKCSQITQEGDRLDRYLLGRQFMVVVVIFVVNLSGAPTENAEIWGLPSWFKSIFLTSGIAMTLFTCMVGQLHTQINASHYMLDCMNNYFGLFTLYAAIFIEFSGLLHASYVLQSIVGRLSGELIETNDVPRNRIARIFFRLRCLMSSIILGFCITVTIYALFYGKTTIRRGVPPGVTVIIFLFLMCVIGMLEGMQVAFLAVAKCAPSERGEGYFAKKTCDLLYFGEGNNLPGFMIGRQLCVVSCMFFITSVISVKIPKDEENIFGVSDGTQEFINTGLLGTLMLTILGSISWQLVATAFPLAFMQAPMTYYLLCLCLSLEGTGICQGAYVLAAIHKRIAGFQRDEDYIGTAEERAKQDIVNDKKQLRLRRRTLQSIDLNTTPTETTMV